jgi:hypothetical protein
MLRVLSMALAMLLTMALPAIAAPAAAAGPCPNSGTLPLPAGMKDGTVSSAGIRHYRIALVWDDTLVAALSPTSGAVQMRLSYDHGAGSTCRTVSGTSGPVMVASGSIGPTYYITVYGPVGAPFSFAYEVTPGVCHTFPTICWP